MTTITQRELSPRQREILALVAAGRTSKEIAGELGISESTVNWHLSNVFERLGASSRAEAVALAMREGAELADDQALVATPGPVRAPLPISMALLVAVTLVLGLLGGALMAGWDFTAPSPPSSSVAPSSGAPQRSEPTVRPSGAGADTTSVPATPAPLPLGAPSIPTTVPVLPLVTLPTVGPLPTLRPVPSVPLGLP